MQNVIKVSEIMENIFTCESKFVQVCFFVDIQNI